MALASRRLSSIFVLLFLQIAPAIAQDKEPLRDENGQWTHRGIGISLVAAAQVMEMRCGLKGQMDAAIAKDASLGIVVDPNEKQDHSDIILVATAILKKADAEGAAVWCEEMAAFPDTLKVR